MDSPPIRLTKSMLFNANKQQTYVEHMAICGLICMNQLEEKSRRFSRDEAQCYF